MDFWAIDRRKALFMRNRLSAFFVMFGLPIVAFAQNKPLTLFNAQTGWAVASNTVFASNGLPMAYNAAYDSGTSSAANYVISEEGSSNTFGSLIYTPGTPEQWTETTATIGWATANISFVSGSYSENLVENSAALACTRNGVAAEYDFFLGPNSYDMGTNVVSAINVAYRSNPALVPSLSQLASLAVSGQMTIDSVSQLTTPATCATNHASVGFNFALVDRKTNQQIAYTLHLGALCLPGSDYQVCSTELENAAIWYQAGGISAVTDTPVGLSSGLVIVPNGKAPTNLPLTTAGTVTFTSVDFLSRLETLIQNNPYNLDKNVSHWQLSGLSYGTNIWGDSAISTSWHGLNAAATCKNANCS